MTALVAARELDREIGATVIHNLITSRAVPELVIERGGTPVRSRVGHSYIKALMADTGPFLAANTRRTTTSAIFGCRLGDAGRAVCPCRTWRTAAATVGADRRLPTLRILRRDQLHRRRRGVGNRGCAEVVRHPDPLHRSPRRVTVDLGNGSWFNLRSSNTEPLLRSTSRALRRRRRGGGRADRRRDRAIRRSAGGRDVNAIGATIDIDDTEGLIAADRDGLLRARRWPARRCAPPPPRPTKVRWTRSAGATVPAPWSG
ncbi:phosphoglucomutase/phosphomannomutase, alpha/beta/alpha domain III family protein [Mycobacterium xenopi 4042]|uniref:Phosphoglucomutase/phosphomannomutase, alpha/beta/alpha domain III family protein n=1 Tax=Mycobacterium xenopi 4042 TaxID=1299334 RepID=X8DEA2_MYCXE|nr:phosphoglucomutase/phosphomannomutase, alpha/beta/alpha domain III family protein [Mycobacterium xenopi 4042]